MEREKSSKRERGSRDGDDDDHRRNRHRDEENRNRSDDRRRQERSIEREGNRDVGHDREDENQHQSDDRRRDCESEGSRDRAYDRERREKSRDRDRREKSFELEVNREGSMERRNSRKRKDRGENVDKRNVDEKRARDSEVKKDNLRVGDVKLMDKEDVEIDEEKKGKGCEMRTVKEEPKPEPYDDGQDVDTIDTVSFFVSILFFQVVYHIYIVVLILPMFVYVLLSSYCHAPLLLGYDAAYFCIVFMNYIS